MESGTISMDSPSHFDSECVSLRFSYDEYVSSPLTLEQMSQYEAQRLRCRNYERNLLSRRLAACGFIGLGGIVLFDLTGAPASISLGFNLSVTLLLSLLVVFQTSKDALRQYPMSLWVGDQNWIRGTSGREFEQITLREQRLRCSPGATNLYRNILDQGRGICEFEQYLIRRIMIADWER